MSYIVFARKYRPKSFDEITGQSHITTTLKNAIEHSRVAHAYLFAGPRGVGKTTTARILAKALNCEKGPTPKPCGKCISCNEIASGSSLDILEIDGASNRGIDEIRSLRENSKFTPVRGKFKVYIIDEVHMLSNEAFNALLKTLEEPPPHVKFIFATTHAHKVPPTILSRCQRFDFRRIPSSEILKNLKQIAKEENLSASDEALGLIVKYSDGSMRDAQVVLDQISAFTKGVLGVEDVAKVLGVVDDEIFFKLSEAMHNKDPRSALKIIDSLVNDGKDVIQTVQGLIGHFRNISVAKVLAQPGALIDAGKEKIARYVEESAKFSTEEMLYIIYTLSNTIDFMRKTDMARIPFETALVKLTLNAGIVPMADLIKRVEALENGGVRDLKSVDSSSRAYDPLVSETAPAAMLRVLQNDDEKVLPQNDDEKVQPKNNTKTGNSLDGISGAWSKVISSIRAKKISVASYLQEGEPLNLEDNVLTIGFAKEYQFHKEVLESNENRKIIEKAISEMLGLNLRVSLTVTASGDSSARTSNQKLKNLVGTDVGDEVAGEIVSDDSDPIVKKALEMFGGKLAVGGSGKGKAA